MGKLLLVFRLATRELQRRPGEAVMLLVVIMTATTALTLGLVLHGVTAHPYQSTRTATAGPDVLAAAFPFNSGPPAYPAGLAGVAPLIHARGVIRYSGPYPVALPVLRANGHTDAVLAEGREPAPAPVDQPKLTEGSWVSNGGVVVERSFAAALGIHAGDRVTLNGRSFRVAGVAVTAALPTSGIGFLEGNSQWPNPGLIWLTEAAARGFATSAQPLGYILNLKLADPAAAGAFADKYDGGDYNNNTGSNAYLIPWQAISRDDGQLVKDEQGILLAGS